MNIHWPSGVITVYKTDSFMQWMGGQTYNMDTNLFRLALKDAEDSEIGICFPDTHRHNTTVVLGGIEYARVLEILPPYTLTFDDAGGGWVCNLTGSNNNILDRTNWSSVQVKSNNSAGMIVVNTTGSTGPSAAEIAAAVRSILASELDIIDFLAQIVRNKRQITADHSLVVYADDGTTPILQKVLKDKDGAAIAPLAAGVMAQEEKSSV